MSNIRAAIAQTPPTGATPQRPPLLLRHRPPTPGASRQPPRNRKRRSGDSPHGPGSETSRPLMLNRKHRQRSKSRLPKPTPGAPSPLPGSSQGPSPDKESTSRRWLPPIPILQGPCCGALPLWAMPTRRCGWRTCISTAKACRRTANRDWFCCARRRKKQTRGRKASWERFMPPANASRKIASKPIAGSPWRSPKPG